MTTYYPPKKNTAFVLYVSLISQANTKVMQSNPTIASGDFKVSIDGGSLANLTTLPAVTPASSKMVKIDLSSSETNGDNITIVCSDAAGAEWCDLVINLQTTARQIDDLAYPATSGRSLAVDSSGGITPTTVESMLLHSGTAQAGAAGSITLASGASATNDLYTGEVVKIYSGTGAGQVRVITAYNGTTKAATVGRNWVTNPDNTSLYAVLALSVPKVNDSLEVTAASVSGNVAGSVGSVSGAVGSVTGNVGGNVVGSVASVTGAVGSVAAGGITAASFAAGALDAVWSTATRLLTAGTNIVLAKGVGVTGFNDLDAAGVRAAVGLAAANLDTQFAATATASSQTTINNNVLTRATPAQVNAEVVDALATDTYAEPGSVPAATSSLASKIGWLFTLARNKHLTTSAVDTLRNDTDTASIATSAISDDGVTFTRGEYT